MSSDYHRKRLGNHDLGAATQMMSYGYDPKMSEGAVKQPVFLTSTFAFENAEAGADWFEASRLADADGDNSRQLIYSRFNHPNLEIIEDRLALLDGGDVAAVTGSGMAAISTLLLTFLKPGDVVMHSSPLYGGTETLLHNLIASLGINAMPFDALADSEQISASFKDASSRGPLKMVYIETPANPTNAMIDLNTIKNTATNFKTERHGTPITVCDNTLLGPIFQRTADFGIDVSVYSLTKYVGGHSDLVAGAVVGKAPLLAQVKKTRSALGTQLDPHSCWMIARSMETLVLRMDRAAQSATKVAQWLSSNPHFPCQVLHPDFDVSEQSRAAYKRQCSGPGSTFSFVVEQPRDIVFKILNAFQIFKLAVSLGGTESLVCHPASTTHSGVPLEVRNAAGVTDGLVRLSVGLEDADDLIADLDHAFNVASGE
ncbi:MAG: cystathionine gamma-synthase family protein [Pseudomonadota bacterium]